MSTDQFEQAKREFVEKWNLKYSKEPTTDPHTECLYYPITPHKSECLSDLNALLEQHKEMILREELIKYEIHWNFVLRDNAEKVVDEYLKNVKK